MDLKKNWKKKALHHGEFNSKTGEIRTDEPWRWL